MNSINDIIRERAGRGRGVFKGGTSETEGSPEAAGEQIGTANAGAGTGQPPPQQKVTMNDAIREIVRLRRALLIG